MNRVPLLGKGLANRGLTLVEIMVVVLIIAIIAAIAVPNFMQSRTSSARTACLANLKAIDAAKDQFAMAKGPQNGDAVAWTDIVPNYIKTTPNCSSGGVYTLNPVGALPTCSLAPIGHQL